VRVQKRDLRILGDTQMTGSDLTWGSVGTVDNCFAADTGKYMALRTQSSQWFMIELAPGDYIKILTNSHTRAEVK
jgi:hypothetical protein